MKINKMEVDEEFHPYHVILINKDETQVSGSEIRLKNCLKDDSCDEVSVEKAGIFRQYVPPEYYGFSKGNHLIMIYMVFSIFFTKSFLLITCKSEVRKTLNHIRKIMRHFGNEFLPLKTC